jgi:hypothetical protein
VNLLIPRNKIAIHAKRQTIMYHDMQLLRDLWKSIAPESVVGAESNDSARQKEQWKAQERRRNEQRVEDMKAQVIKARVNGTLHKLPAGVKCFCRMHKIDFS